MADGDWIKLLGKLAAGAKDVGTVAQTVGTITSMIPKPDDSKRGAADAQRNIESVALDIERRLKSGEIDPDTALQIIASLERQALNLQATGNYDYVRGGQTAALIIANVKSNALQMKTAAANRPLDKTTGLSGSNDAQLAQFSTAVRNKLIGAPAGDSLSGTPVDQLFQPRPSAMSRLPGVRQSVEEQFPNPDTADFLERMRARINRPAPATTPMAQEPITPPVLPRY